MTTSGEVLFPPYIDRHDLSLGQPQQRAYAPRLWIYRRSDLIWGSITSARSLN